MKIGPYSIVDTLGRGGMGVVYRGVHEHTSRQAAVKTVSVASETLLASFQREIRSLARIEHPGVVRVRDHGVDSGLPWFAMDLIDGVPLKHYVPASPHDVAAMQTLPLGSEPVEQPADSHSPAGSTLEERLTVVHRLCSALAFLHGEGIVHRDLKPANVIVKPGLEPVLVDFGIAVESLGGLGREKIGADFGSSGTAPYMAPEQLMGEVVDARADLYSLGCLLYELITGHPPFRGTLHALQVAHLTQVPVPPSHHADCPPELDELVARLLEKQPRRRIGHADDVAEALLQLGASPGDKELPEPRAYLYRPGFAGRGTVIEQFHDRIDRLSKRAGGLVLIEGESGVGKTRLGIEVARLAALGRARFFTGECQPPDAAGDGTSRAQPLQAFAGMLGSVAYRSREMGEKATDSRVLRNAKVLAPFAPAMAEVPGFAETPEPPVLPPESARLRLYSALWEVLAELATLSPILILVDDLQWADELTLGFVEHLSTASTLSGSRVLLICLYRSEEATDAIRRIAGDPNVQRMRLERLGNADVASIVSDMLALEPAPAALSDFLSVQSEGNPFFVAEYLRSALEERMLTRTSRGVWQIREHGVPELERSVFEQLQLPGALRDLVSRRLAGLPPVAAALARQAAVFGREVSFSLLLRAWDQKMREQYDVDMLDGTADLLRRQVLEEPTPGVLRFAHDKIRESAYAGIEPHDRSVLHRRAAEAIESGPAGQRAGMLASLGAHWEHGGDPGKARECYLGAARSATSRYALEEAGRLFDSFLNLSTGPTIEDIAARNELGNSVLRTMGRIAEAAVQHRAALEHSLLIEDLSSELESSQSLATDEFMLGEHTAALEHYTRAVELTRKLKDRHAEALVLARLAVFHHERSNPTEAFSLYEQALETAREFGDRATVAVVLGNFANLHYDLGRHDEAWWLYEQALAEHREIGDEIGEGRVLGNLAAFACFQGRPDEADEPYSRALEIHRRIGNRRDEGITLTNMGNLRIIQGRPEEALDMLTRAYEIQSSIGYKRYAAVALATRGVLERRMGRLDKATELLQQAVSDLTGVGDMLYAAVYQAQRGHVALAREESPMPFLESATEMADVLGAGPEGEVRMAIADLERAIAAKEEGAPLFMGECAEDVPPALARWLDENPSR